MNDIKSTPHGNQRGILQTVIEFKIIAAYL